MHVTFDLGDPEDDDIDEDNVDEDNVGEDNIHEANIDIWILLICFHFYLYVNFSNIFIRQFILFL